jgi:8-oxo-dGTP pyrophosphatase MutT (NUDIX family)
LILQRALHRSSPGKWNHVTGYIQERESAEEAALRELKEETNLEGEIVKTTEPFWVDSGDTRWVVISSLIEVSNEDEIKVDENESQAYEWIDLSDERVSKSNGMRESFKELGLLTLARKSSHSASQ